MQAGKDASIERRYKKAREKVRSQTLKFEKCKKAYLTTMFDIERKTIKVKLAVNKDTTSQAILEMKRLIEKSSRLHFKYVAQMAKWRAKLKLFLAVASEKAKTERGNVTELIRRAVIDKTSDDDVHTGLNIEKLLEKENIHEPVFEEYIPAGNKSEMYDPIKLDAASNDWGYDSDSSETYCEKEGGTKEGRQLPAEWKSHIYSVIKEYKRQKIDELNLHTGEKVKQILSADPSGMAFGVKKYGMIRKKKGFYPVSHVCKVKDAENARKSRTSQKERLNPIARAIDAVKEPKTKLSLLKEIVSDDVTTKVYTEKKRKKRNVFTLKNWLKFYGIELPDEDTCDSKHDEKHVPPTPTRIKSAKSMSSDKCTFIRREQCNEAGYYPSQIKYNINTPQHGGELVLEDIEDESEFGDDLSDIETDYYL